MNKNEGRKNNKKKSKEKSKEKSKGKSKGKEKEKAAEEKRKKEEAALFKPIQVQKVPFGVDPKTILCAYFKAGTCDKGSKCKFSHDMNVGRKVDKKNVYEDSREDKAKGACYSRVSTRP